MVGYAYAFIGTYTAGLRTPEHVGGVDLWTLEQGRDCRRQGGDPGQ